MAVINKELRMFSLFNLLILFTSRKVHQHVRQARTLGGQFVQHGVCDQLDGQLNVSQRRPESYGDQRQ